MLAVCLSGTSLPRVLEPAYSASFVCLCRFNCASLLYLFKNYFLKRFSAQIESLACNNLKYRLLTLLLFYLYQLTFS